MIVRFIADYRGWLTNEAYYKAGVYDVDNDTAAALIKHGRAVDADPASDIGETPPPLLLDIPEPTIPATDKPNRKIKASKAAHALAAKHNLLLWSVNGTGRGGSITLKDVQKLVK